MLYYGYGYGYGDATSTWHGSVMAVGWGDRLKRLRCRLQVVKAGVWVGGSLGVVAMGMRLGNVLCEG